jgi:hypothetical protein
MVDRMRGSSLRRDEPVAIVGGVISFLFDYGSAVNWKTDNSKRIFTGWHKAFPHHH